jgi:hypothetical protein
MMNNNFAAIASEPLPADLVGIWTGSMGPYLVSMKWQADGNGLFCYSHGTANVVQKIKFGGGEILIQDGTKLNLKQHSKESLVVHAPYFAARDSTLYSDSQLRSASVYCADAFG